MLLSTREFRQRTLMEYDFETAVDRTDTGSEKWEQMKKLETRCFERDCPILHRRHGAEKSAGDHRRPEKISR